MQYFQMNLELGDTIDDQWYLSNIVNSGGKIFYNEIFRKGQKLNLAYQPTIEIIRSGPPLDFTMTAFGVPVVSAQFADLVINACHNCIERIPVIIGNQIEGWEILNILPILSCVDHAQTYVGRYAEELKASAPDLVGKIQYLANIKIIPPKVDTHLFRLVEWDIVIIVSEILKREIEAANFSGCSFVAV